MSCIGFGHRLSDRPLRGVITIRVNQSLRRETSRRRPLLVRPARCWLFPVLVVCVATSSPQSVDAQARGTDPQVASAVRTIGGGSEVRGIMADRPASSGGFAVLGMAGLGQSQNDERVIPIPLYDFPQASGGGSAWKKGLVIGAVAGVALGILVHAAIDSIPCDSCAGTGTSAAEGTRLELAVVFGLAGAGLGAFLGSRR